jgi:hypothetical protein
MISDSAMLYAIHWPESGVLKVGRAHSMSRIWSLTAMGGRVVSLLRDTPRSWEQGALAEMDATFERAFQSWGEALHHLPRGSGFTECFRVTTGQLHFAVRTICRGIKRYGYQSDPVGAAEVLPGGGLPSVAVAGEDDVSGVDDVRGRLRERVVQSGVVEVGVVASGGDNLGGVDRGTSGVFGGRRVSASVHGGFSDVLRDFGLVGVAAGGQADGVEGSETSSRAAREWLASGSRPARGRGERRERGCGRVRESARRGCRVWRGEHLATGSGGSVPVLSKASRRNCESVPRVRYCSSPLWPLHAGDDRSGRFGGRARPCRHAVTAGLMGVVL